MRVSHPAAQHPSVPDIALTRLDGTPETLQAYRGDVLLIVNVASKCGKTPQYSSLQSLFDRYRQDGFVVLGFPCNQFGLEEPGDAAEIAAFCSLNYGVTFPMFEKVRVNGPKRHPLYEVLTKCPDDDGVAGDIQWNFEKFLVARDGTVAARYRDAVNPAEPEFVHKVEELLAADRSAGRDPV